MTGYVIRRLIVAVIVTFGIAFITFALLHFLSPSPVYDVLGAKAQPAAVKSWNNLHGYDRPEPVQFLSYTGHLVHLDFGYSYKLSQSVNALFKENAGRSIYLTAAALVLSLVIAIPLGIGQAVKRNSVADYAVTTVNFILYSMPSFFLGLILIQIFALDLGIFPPTVSTTITTTWGAITHPLQLALPILTLALINVASFSRYMRSSALDNLAQDYIRLARAKGLSERAVLFRHLLRNACLPMITLVRTVDSHAPGGQPADRGAVQLPGPRAALLQRPGQSGLQHSARLHDPGRVSDGAREPPRRYRDHRRRSAGAACLIRSDPSSRARLPYA